MIDFLKIRPISVKVNIFMLILALSLVPFWAGGTNSSEGYKIEVSVNGIHSREIYLGYHYGSKDIVIDTAFTNNQGFAVFTGNEKLRTGVYFVLLEDKKYFELIIDDSQVFEASADIRNLIFSMKISGSPENKLFYEYQAFAENQRRREARIKQRMALNRDDKDSLNILQHEFNILLNETDQVRNRIIEKNPEFLFSKILQAMLNPKVPQAPKDKNGKITDSLFQYRYYRDHYFENIDFSEPGLVRTSMLNKKYLAFFEQLVMPVFDSLKVQVDRLAALSKENDEVHQYTINWMLMAFDHSPGGDLDEIFVYIADTYYLNSDNHWGSEEYFKKIKQRTDKIRSTFVGQAAPDLRLFTENEEVISIHQLNSAFKVLVFWSTDCEHCKEKLPQLSMRTRAYSKNTISFAGIYVGNEKNEWIKLQEEFDLAHWINLWDPEEQTQFRDKYDIYRTPEIYILNSKNEIAARRVNPDFIEETILLLMNNRE